VWIGQNVQVLLEEGTVVGFQAVARDITDRKNKQDKLAAMADELRVMAVVDELTGLHNRRGFTILATEELKRATEEDGQPRTIYFADLDGLKGINDNLGHEMGDRAICDAAALLHTAFEGDILGRLGGDEFVILTTDAEDEADEDASKKRLEALVESYNASTPARPFTLGISIGAAVISDSTSTTIDEVMKQADEAMYEVKLKRKAARANQPDKRIESRLSLRPPPSSRNRAA